MFFLPYSAVRQIHRVFIISSCFAHFKNDCFYRVLPFFPSRDVIICVGIAICLRVFNWARINEQLLMYPISWVIVVLDIFCIEFPLVIVFSCIFRWFGMPIFLFECISTNATHLRFGCFSAIIGKEMECKRGCVARECNAMTIVMHVLCVM